MMRKRELPERKNENTKKKMKHEADSVPREKKHDQSEGNHFSDDEGRSVPIVKNCRGGML